MTPLRCIAIDDEPLALTVISEYCQKVPFLQLINTFTHPTEAAASIITEKPDVLFLDIQMPGIKGIDFAKTLQYKPSIIFTTAYPEYAIEGFNVDAIDYLLKPIPFERFLQAVNKLIKMDTPPIVPIKDYLFAKSGYKTIKVNFDEIVYFESTKEFVTVCTIEHKFVKTDTLKHLEESLPSGQFIRVHKSFIVNLAHVKAFYGNTIETSLGEIPIGRAYKETVTLLLQS